MQDRTTLIIVGAIVVGVLGLGVLLYLNVRPTPPITDLVQYPRPERGHDNSLEFAYEDYALPPPGGIHWDIWQNCGIYDTPIEIGYAIHALEHGAVWIAYEPDLAADEVTELQSYVQGVDYLLLAPYPNLQSPVVLTAWGVQLEVDDAGDGRIAQFIEKYRLGSQTPEPGATCQSGVGDPIDRNVPIGSQAMESP